MKKLLILLVITFLTVGCSNINLQKQSSSKTSQTIAESSQDNILQIEDVEGYWECKSSEEEILLKLGWKNDIDLYYSDGSKEISSYNIVKANESSITIQIRDDDETVNAIIKTDNGGETITLKKNDQEHYFIRIPKDQFYVKLVDDYTDK